MIPETQRDNQDVVDLLTTAGQEVKEIRNEHGDTERILELNPDIFYWKLHSVASNRFARMVLLVKLVEKKAEEAQYNMSKPRAQVLKKQILHVTEAYRRSIDAKSSETILNKDNKQPNLINQIKSNVSRQEKVYSAKDEKTKSMLAGIIGRDEEKDN